MSWLATLCLLVEVYILLGIALNLTFGYAGLMFLCTESLFFGVGAYTSALVVRDGGFPLELGLLSGGLAAAGAGCMCVYPIRRYAGDLVALATLAYQLVFEEVLLNWKTVTNGPIGLRGIPRGTFLGIDLSSDIAFAAFGGVVALGAYCIQALVVGSPFGRNVQAVRDEDGAAESLGISASATRVRAVTISAFIGGIAGGLYAHFFTYIDPTSFSLAQSIFILSIVVLGGAGGRMGPAIGALVFVLLPEVLRLLDVPSAVAANVRAMLYGLALVLLMIFRPQGLVGKYDLS